jgi:hypothetical protein
MSNRTEATLAATLREMIAQGWTDSEAHDNKEAFFNRIGNVTDKFTEDQVYEVWGYVYEDVMDEFKMNWEVTARNIINSGLYEAAEALMDDDIREDLNREIAPCAIKLGKFANRSVANFPFFYQALNGSNSRRHSIGRGGN